VIDSRHSLMHQRIVPTPKKFQEPVTLGTRYEREKRDALECLAERLQTDTAELLRQAIDSLLEANPVSPDELNAWRRKRARAERLGAVPGLRKPRGAVARLVTVDVSASAVGAETDTDRAGMEKKGIEPSTSRTVRAPAIALVLSRSAYRGPHRTTRQEHSPKKVKSRLSSRTGLSGQRT
jgi:hypothetical protein